MFKTSFCTHLPARQEVLPDELLEEKASRTFQTIVAVRPARLVFHGLPRPRTDELVWRIWESYASESDKAAKKAIHTPFVYRGHVDAHVNAGDAVRVRLSEEPSGRPLIAELPWDWFRKANLVPYKGFPFRLVTWMVEKDERMLEPRCWVESLLEMKTTTETP